MIRLLLPEANAGAWSEPPSPRVLGANGVSSTGFFASSALIQQSGSPIDAGVTKFFYIALGN